MGFSLGAFGRGFATAAVTDKKETEDRVNDLVDQAYLEKLKDAKELRKDRKAKRESLISLANQYKAMGITEESQIAGLIAVGPEAAARNLELLQATAQTYRQQDKVFDINSFVKGTGIEGLTIEDGINRIMGEAQPADQDFVMDIPGAKKDRGVLGGLFADPQKIAQKRMEERESVYGESMGQLAAETGDLTYGDVGQVSLDLGAMFLPDEDRDLDRRIKEAQANLTETQVKELKAEIEQLQAGTMEPDDMRSNYRLISSILGPQLLSQSGTVAGWDDVGGRIVQGDESKEKTQELNENLNDLNQKVIGLMQGPNKMTLDNAIKYAGKTFVPEYYAPKKETDEEKAAREAREAASVPGSAESVVASEAERIAGIQNDKVQRAQVNSLKRKLAAPPYNMTNKEILDTLAQYNL